MSKIIQDIVYLVQQYSELSFTWQYVCIPYLKNKAALWSWHPGLSPEENTIYHFYIAKDPGRTVDFIHTQTHSRD